MTARRSAATVVFLGVLVALNYYLRHTLESADLFMYSYYKVFYAKAEQIVFSPAFPTWKLLLPIPEFTGIWNTSTIVLMRLLEPYLAPATEWYLCNAVLIVASFWISWAAFRSRVFSFTLAICLGFGTQLYVAYSNSGGISAPLLFVYYELLMLCIYKLIVAERHRALWTALFAPALLVAALGYEQWLDLLAIVWVVSAYLFVMFGRMGLPVLRRRLLAVAGVMTAVGAIYIAIKLTRGYGQTYGMESDVVYNYPVVAPAIEDFVSNAFTNLYMAVTFLLPPALVSSTAYYRIGAEQLVQLQHGYHAPFTYLVPMHYLFEWRYLAGVVATVFVLVLFKLARRAWNAPVAGNVAWVVLLLMVGVGGIGPIHSLIKARPMNAMPVQTYHVLNGVLAVAILISYIAMVIWNRQPRTPARVVIVGGIWTVVFYSALARPAMISHQAAQVGLDTSYPDPLETLYKKLGRRYDRPAGLIRYQLATPAPAKVAPPAPPPFGPALDPMPNQAPPVEKWKTFSGVTVSSSGNLETVQGNDSASGYQIMSPEIAVPPGRRLFVRVRGIVDQGRVCLGILAEGQQTWLLAATPDRTRSEYSADTGKNKHVSFVFANCKTDPDDKAATKFRLASVTYGLVETALEATR